MTLPKRYVPKSLQPVPSPWRELCYAVGVEHKPGMFGMVYGPTPTLEEMLETVPAPLYGEPGHVLLPIWLIRFNTDGSETLLYRWCDSAWVLAEPLDTAVEQAPP